MSLVVLSVRIPAALLAGLQRLAQERRPWGRPDMSSTVVEGLTRGYPGIADAAPAPNPNQLALDAITDASPTLGPAKREPGRGARGLLGLTWAPGKPGDVGYVTPPTPDRPLVIDATKPPVAKRKAASAVAYGRREAAKLHKAKAAPRAPARTKRAPAKAKRGGGK